LEQLKARDADGIQLPAQTWRAIAITLLVVGVLWVACGLLLAAFPSESADVDSDTTWAQISRGCCLGPAFALGFLAYGAALVGRRRDHRVRLSELAAALGLALGLIFLLMGLALIVQSGDERDPFLGALCCVLPGIFIIALSGVFWMLFGQRR
jgi:hypothetical protein